MTLKEFLSENDRFAAESGVELLEIKEGQARARMLIEPRHLNGGGVCQGGALFTLADLAFAAAANSRKALTLSITSNVTFFRSESAGYLYAEAVEVVNHKKIPCIEVRITNEQGDLVALMTSSGYRKSCELPVEGLE